ncbi:carboxypeptidase-like regulatory domain-containing protein [candidate division KSB1 bacterium]|nr:carboxypeptidase-like regulatory domain-containing protein [candidate division KSB1 bacterium]
MPKLLWKLLLICVLFAPNYLWAQAEPRGTVSGRVKDAATGKPLPNVNVFLANTTLGTATDKDGFYAIKRVPLGTHELFASLIGYQVEKRVVRLVEPKDLRVDLSLQPKALELGEVEVVAAQPREWKKNLKKFEELFWGNSYDADECKILNPEVLDFAFEKEPKCFAATAGQPLQIENRTLGYRAQFLIEDFRYYIDEDKIGYAFIPKFDELLPADADEESKWQANRQKAYRGSLRHFLVVLVADRLREEGFILYRLAVPPWEDKHVRRLAAELDELLSSGTLPNERELHFKGCLEIIYTPERGDNQVSWIVSSRESVTVNAAGYIYNGYAVTVYGYWFNQRVAEMLPRDYQP